MNKDNNLNQNQKDNQNQKNTFSQKINNDNYYPNYPPNDPNRNFLQGFHGNNFQDLNNYYNNNQIHNLHLEMNKIQNEQLRLHNDILKMQNNIDNNFHKINKKMDSIRIKNNNKNNIPIYNKNNHDLSIDAHQFDNLNKNFDNGQTEISMIIHAEDLMPNIKQKNKLNNIPGNPFNILASLFNQFDDKQTKEASSEKIEENEDENINYDSEDEFEELKLEINTLDDLIKLGDVYDQLTLESKLLEDSTDNDSVELDQEVKNFNANKKKLHKKILKERYSNLTKPNKFYTASPLKNPTKNISINKSKLIEKKKVSNRTIYKLNGKNYSINLEIVKKLQPALKKLQSLVGLQAVKNSIIDMILYYLQCFEKTNQNMLHTVIEGPPGVGKTELGKILAEIYASLGIIKSNKFKIMRRTDLVGEYLGHTAQKTQRAIDEADGGVLFIDEAYSLGNEEKRDSFAKECIDTINQNLSENKKNFICIIAGYPDELEKCFFSMNPGLKRRFPFKFKIDGYSAEEMRDIFLKKINDSKWTLEEKEVDKNELTSFFRENKNEFSFYGGDLENLLVECKFMHSRRIVGKHPKFRRILSKEDLHKGLEKFIENRKNNQDYIKIYSMIYT
ncbi:AAA family ATPase [uncultured virus]|nr:AAA family ATPase [uncultured virus]